jgi:hypothetical protein
MVSEGKYSVQNGIFIDWKVAYKPPEGVGVGASGGPGLLSGKTSSLPYMVWCMWRVWGLWCGG